MGHLSSFYSPGLPHNPELRDLIAGKRRWASKLTREESKAGFKGWHERGYLPHRDEPGLIQMVTFRVVDSFPRALRCEWEAILKIEEDDVRRKKLQAYLDRGRGTCPLRQARVAGLIEEAFRSGHQTDYELRSWVVMPNHVHVLFKITAKPMGIVIGNWKKTTGRKVNKLLRRTGKFWARDYWDTFIRDENHELKARHYTEKNPVIAGLVREAKDWPWSSARFRDNYGNMLDLTPQNLRASLIKDGASRCGSTARPLIPDRESS